MIFKSGNNWSIIMYMPSNIDENPARGIDFELFFLMKRNCKTIENNIDEIKKTIKYFSSKKGDAAK